jgi:hypothetical protein
MRVRYIVLVLFGCFVLLVYIPAQAQDAATCSPFVESSLQQVGTNCANLESGNACYGHPGVTIATTDPASNQAFSEVANRVGLTDATSVQTTPFDPVESNWGIAVMNVQANLPKAMPGKGVVLIPMGGVTLSDAVSDEDTLVLPDQPLDIIIDVGGADLYMSPLNFNAVSEPFAHVPQDTLLQADGISKDGQWLRVFVIHDQKYAQSPIAWVKLSNVANAPGIDKLPIIGPNSKTLLQSLYLTNTLDQPSCNDIPSSMLYVQGPEEVLVDLTVNGADIHFGSTILIRIMPPGNRMQLIVLSGLGLLYPNTPNEIVITPGFASEICLADINQGDDPNKRTIGQNCTWSIPQVLSFEELESLYNQLDNKIPENLQYYRTYVPRLVCPSGVGQVQCRIRLAYVRLIIRLNRLCQTGILPKAICDRYILR